MNEIVNRLKLVYAAVEKDNADSFREEREIPQGIFLKNIVLPEIGFQLALLCRLGKARCYSNLLEPVAVRKRDGVTVQIPIGDAACQL